MCPAPHPTCSIASRERAKRASSLRQQCLLRWASRFNFNIHRAQHCSLQQLQVALARRGISVGAFTKPRPTAAAKTTTCTSRRKSNPERNRRYPPSFHPPSSCRGPSSSGAPWIPASTSAMRRSVRKEGFLTVWEIEFSRSLLDR